MHKLYDDEEMPPRLKGQRCGSCDRVAFPPNPYGCETCGAFGAQVEEQLLAGKGRLLAFVTTHHANQRDISVPYTIASIALEDGPVVRALMNTPTDSALKVNDAVESVLVGRQAPTGDAVDELRFRVSGAD
ncbi:OB-fold domain-containing protein [Henriciella sp. AS95]|uniref:Zn-ribbon domain-containing OB-fold protein n=1 Tax=Henriciella sp. AS95 TaxID=3135782 RepID=UPI003178DEB1